MSEKETFTEKKLRGIRSDEHSSVSQKKRKLSRIILIVDALIIVLILVFIYKKEPEQSYHSASINYKNTQIRFSTGIDTKTSNHLFSLSLKSNSNKKKILLFKKNLATLMIQHDDKLIVNKVIGVNITKLKLLPGETKSFFDIVDSSDLDNFASKNPEYILPRKKTLIQFEKTHIPLKAIILLNLDDELSSSIDFKHEVED